MKYRLLMIALTGLWNLTFAQLSMERIKSPFAVQTERDKLERSLYNRSINFNFSLPLNLETEHRFQSSFYSVTQFMVSDSMVDIGFEKTFQSYDSLSTETKRSFLEALYTINPASFREKAESLFNKEIHPKLSAMLALYLYRTDSTSIKSIRKQIVQKYPDFYEVPVLTELVKYLDKTGKQKKQALPEITDLFSHQAKNGFKTIYSFQRWNRDYPGLAVIQQADGRFARDEKGKLVVIRQLARAASNLPYFLTNGNTPQGIYSIQGIDTSFNNLIGPTPNLQMLMPFELYWNRYFHTEQDTSFPILAYHELLPESWQEYLPMEEAFYAGKAGRTEIIAHGTTIDPKYFAGKPFFPISPTLGCLCARETWNPSTGKLVESEQFRLVEHFLRTDGDKGYLMVININDKPSAVYVHEIEAWINKFEAGLISR